MHQELGLAAGVAEERVLLQPCIMGRLREVERLLRTAQQTDRLPDIGGIGFPPLRPSQHAAWETALGSGTLVHFSPAEQASLTLIYSELADIQNSMSEEQRLWSSLHVLEGVQGKISDNILSSTASELAKLRWVSFFGGTASAQVLSLAAKMHVKTNQAFVSDTPLSDAEFIAQVRADPLCRPFPVEVRQAGVSIPAGG